MWKASVELQEVENALSYKFLLETSDINFVVIVKIRNLCIFLKARFHSEDTAHTDESTQILQNNVRRFNIVVIHALVQQVLGRAC